MLSSSLLIMPKNSKKTVASATGTVYVDLVVGIRESLDTARRSSARAVNALMTATYWEIGRRIVEFEQGGKKRAGYGKELLAKLSADLTGLLGRGFSQRNLQAMRLFYLASPPQRIWQTLSAKSTGHHLCSTSSPEPASAPSDGQAPSYQTLSSKSPAPIFTLNDLARVFPLPWSHYVLLISRSRSSEAFAFYHAEALRRGWSVRQLQRQMDSRFYERIAFSRDKAARNSRFTASQNLINLTA